MQDNRLILGFYLKPHVWIVRKDEYIDAEHITEEECLEVVFTKTLPYGIEVCVQRQGFVIAAIPEALLSVRVSAIKSANLLSISAAQFALDFFNTFLFLLYDQTYKHYNGGYASIKQAVNTSDLWRWRNQSDLDLSMIAIKPPMPILNQHEMLSIDTAPYLLGKAIGKLSADDKLFRWTQSTIVLDNAFEVMFADDDYLLNWQLVALLNKALWSIQRAEFADAHVLCWSVAEKLIDAEWRNYIDSTNESVGDKGEKTVNRERRKHLSSPDYEASKRVEILELAKALSYDLYKRLGEARKTRNKWIHSLESVNQEDSRQCYLVARDMMSRKLKYPIEHPGSYYFQDDDMSV